MERKIYRAFLFSTGLQTEDIVVVEKREFRVEFALRGHKRHVQRVRGDQWRQRFGRSSPDQISKSVTGLSGWRVVRREETFASPAVGRDTGRDENSSTAAAEDIVDLGSEEGPRQVRNDDRVAVQQDATGHHTGRTQIARGAVRAQQSVSSGQKTRRTENSDQSQFAAANASAKAAEKDQHTSSSASAKQRQDR